MSAIARLQFDDISTPVDLSGAADLLAIMPAILRSWHFVEVSHRPDGSKDPILVSREQDRYVIRSRWLDSPITRRDPVNAICALIIELVWAYLEDYPNLLCLHGAAVEFAGRLVVFPDKYRAGKSLLSGCLAAAGQRIYADDILPIEIGTEDGRIEGAATGVAPRLRLPLPENLSDDMGVFLDAHAGPESRRYRYLSLDNNQQARRHDRLPIGAFVLLQREEGCQPMLEDVRRGEVLSSVVWQNFARHLPSGTILHILQSLVSSTQLYRLHYSSTVEAVDILQAKFADWQTAVPQIPDSANATLHVANTAITPELKMHSGQYQQMPGVVEHASDDEHFLADSTGVAIHHLNSTAATVWRLLALPMSRQQIVDLFHSAFPDQPRDRIAKDVTDLIDKLAAKQLLQCSHADAGDRKGS